MLNNSAASALLAAFLLLMTHPLAAASPEDTPSDTAWELLRQGKAVAIMRHALAPGTSDPAGFDVNDCATQRNLSNEGRAQSREIGKLFRSHRIENARVISSQWCRCKETASLLDLGPVSTLPALNSFFENRSASGPQTQELTSRLPEWLQEGSTPTVLVTHQVNIRALTNTFTGSGEILIITQTDGELVVLASIATLD